MVRTRNTVASHRRKMKILRKAKGYWGDRKNHLRLSSDAVIRALDNNYRHRKMKKRDFRALWITRLSAAAKMHGISYSKMIHGLNKAGCLLNRKVLADMALRDPTGFAQVMTKAKEAIAS